MMQCRFCSVHPLCRTVDDIPDVREPEKSVFGPGLFLHFHFRQVSVVASVKAQAVIELHCQLVYFVACTPCVKHNAVMPKIANVIALSLCLRSSLFCLELSLNRALNLRIYPYSTDSTLPVQYAEKYGRTCETTLMIQTNLIDLLTRFQQRIFCVRAAWK